MNGIKNFKKQQQQLEKDKFTFVVSPLMTVHPQILSVSFFNVLAVEILICKSISVEAKY